MGFCFLQRRALNTMNMIKIWLVNIFVTKIRIIHGKKYSHCLLRFRTTSFFLSRLHFQRLSAHLYILIATVLGYIQDITNTESTWDSQKPNVSWTMQNKAYHGDRPYHSSFTRLLSDPWMLINVANIVFYFPLLPSSVMLRITIFFLLFVHNYPIPVFFFLSILTK